MADITQKMRQFVSAVATENFELSARDRATAVSAVLDTYDTALEAVVEGFIALVLAQQDDDDDDGEDDGEDGGEDAGEDDGDEGAT